jgi:hypothetical protein
MSGNTTSHRHGPRGNHPVRFGFGSGCGIGIGLLALTTLLAPSISQARGHDDVQWTVTVGTPAPAPRVVVAPPPAVVYPVAVPVRVAYQRPTRWDRDGDGIPDRHDRLYNPWWDVDGDGIPNRVDRAYNPPRGPVHHAGGHDRDRDGIPDRYDPRPYRPDGRFGR